LQARPATKLNNIFLFFFSQQKEEHTMNCTPKVGHNFWGVL